jgi:hypothetical protein
MTDKPDQRGTLTLKTAETANPSAGSSETVTVACKLPNGLTMRLFHAVSVDYPLLGGGRRTENEFHEIPDSPRYTLNGWSHDQKVAPEYTIIGGAGGFALTHGIPKDFWEVWLKQNEKSDVVRKGLIFAHVREANTIAEAREKKELRSGFERIDPTKRHRVGKVVIETDDAA